MPQQPWTYNFPEFEPGVIDPMKRSQWAGDSIYNYGQLPSYAPVQSVANNVSGYGGFTNVGMPKSEPLPNFTQPAGNFASPATASAQSSAGTTTAFTPPPAPPPIVNPNTGIIGNDIAQYYTAAMKNDPRMANIMSNITGEVPADVLARIEQVGAERGVGIGSYGGGNDQTAMLRALGLTSMDLKDKGVAQYGDFYNSIPKLNPDSLFVNPTEQARMNLQRELTTQEQKASWDRLQSQIAATASLSDKDRAAALHLAQLGFQNKAYLQDKDLAAAKAQYEYLAKNQYNMSQNAINAAWQTFLVENNTRRDLGFAALQNQSNMNAAQLGQSGYMFDTQRADAITGANATTNMINSILNRNQGLLTGSFGYGTSTPPSGGGAGSYSQLDPNLGSGMEFPDVAYGGFERDFAL